MTHAPFFPLIHNYNEEIEVNPKKIDVDEEIILTDDEDDEMLYEEIGMILSVSDGVIRLVGVEKLFVGEIVLFFDTIKAATLNLGTDDSGLAMLASEEALCQGDVGKRTYKEAQIAVGISVLNKILTPLGDVILDTSLETYSLSLAE